jgi:hypothetical protein
MKASAVLVASAMVLCCAAGRAASLDVVIEKLNAAATACGISEAQPFEPDEVEVYLDGKKLALEPGQSVMPHGIDRGPDPDEILNRGDGPAGS